MPSDIQRQLAVVRLQCRKPPRTREAEGEVLRAFKRERLEQRATIVNSLSEVSAFGPLDSKTLGGMADATFPRDVASGEVVAAQDAFAKEFYVVVSGEIRVSRRAVQSGDAPEEVNRLHAGSNFGGGALLTGEQYCTTYEAVGEVQLAVMTAEDFHACIDRAIVNKSNTAAGGGGTERRGDESSTATAEGDDSQNLTSEGDVKGDGAAGTSQVSPAKRAHGVNDQHERVANAVNRVPIFSPLSTEQKRLVSNALLEVHFPPGLYICEEGKPGSSFHIITAGRCRVTIHDPNAPGQQREVTKLHQDDFFGEVALMESGLRTATVVAETDVMCLSLTRRHFDLYLKPIKAAILESAAAKEILDMRGDDEDFDDEMDGGFENSKGEDTTGGRGARGTTGADGRVEGDSDSKGRGGAGRASRTGFRSYATGGRRRKRLTSFRGVAAFALQVQKRERIKFYDSFGNTTARPEGHQNPSKNPSGAMNGRWGSNNSGTLVEAAPASASGLWCQTTIMVRSIARKMVFALENDTYAMLLDEMIERPTGLPEFNRIVSEVLSENLTRWDVAYDRIQNTARHALSKGANKLKDGELAVVSGMLRLHPLLRQRHCSDWADYHWAELCKRMCLEDVQSLDKLFVHGAHGTKCYILLRGLARVLQPEEDERTGHVYYRPHADLGPGDVVGDSVLEGVPQRSTTVVAVTDCQFAVLEEADYAKVRDRGHSQMSLDDKCHHLKSFAMMRPSSTYHLYKIALLVKAIDAAKDSVILKAGESSRALYFIIAGTVEVIQLKKRRVRARHAGVMVGGDKGMTRGAVAKGDADGTSPREREGNVEFVYKTARRVLTVLESGEYFGESGVITFSNGGSKATAAQPAVTEQFSLVAGTNVELLVLRRKHFNIIEMPMLEILKANHDARMRWRARRKEEAHRGRAVLRAAKKALDQAAVRMGEEDDPRSLATQSQSQQHHRASAPASGLSFDDIPRPAGGGGSCAASWRPPLPHGAVGQGVGAVPEGAECARGEGGGDDISLAGLSVASGDSMQYSVDSGWLPDLRAAPTPLDSAGRTEVGAWPTQDEDERYPHDQHPSSPQLRSGPSGGVLPAGPAAESVSPALASPTMSTCVSLPNLPSPATAGRETITYGSDENGVKGGGVRRRKHFPRGWAAQGGVAAAGASNGGSRRPYAGHKQPGLHGCKSFGAFWGETPTPTLIRKNDSRQQRDASMLYTSATAIEYQRRETFDPEFRVANDGGVGRDGLEVNGAIVAGGKDRVFAGKTSELGTVFGGSEGMEVVPSISGMRHEKDAVGLAPVRGISRVLAMG